MMTGHISDERIPNNVDLSSDRRLQRALALAARRGALFQYLVAPIDGNFKVRPPPGT